MTAHDQAELARALFDEIGDALFLVDPETDRLVDANPAAVRLTGFARAELVGTAAEHLLRADPPGGRGPVRQALTESAVLHAPDGYWLRCKPAPGWVPVGLTVSRLHVRPRPLGLLLARDDRGRRAAADALAASERRFRALVEKSRDGILLVDAAGTVLYASPAAESQLGYDPAAAVGRSGFDFVDPADRPLLHRLLAEVLARPGEVVPGRFRAVAAGGEVRVVETSGVNRLADPSVRAIVVNYQDVTARDQSARDRQQQHALMAGLFASVPDVIVYKDRELRFLGGNPAFEALAGRPVADLVGRHCAEVFDAPWAARLRAAEPGVVAAGRTVRARDWVTYPDGREALLDVVVSPLKADDGQVLGLILVGRDVTDRDRLELQLREAQKLEAVGRLAGGIAHDFNNLLTVVLGNLELVRAGADRAEAAELLAQAERAARQAAELTGRMLGFARRRPVRTSAVDLNALAAEALALLRRTVDPRIVFAHRPAADLGPVAADPAQVQQVLMNLCLNARDAMPDGGTLTVATERCRLKIEDRRLEDANSTASPGLPPPPVNRQPPIPDRQSDYARLTVADTGVGMPPEVRARAFEPFFTTKEVGKGTGLGLAMVYGIARAHGGWVECRSTAGKGTRFDVYLPLAADLASGGREPPDGSAAGPDTPRPAADTPRPVRGRGETVLVADDEPGVRALARAGLEAFGYRVVEAADGAEAVAVFGREGGRVGVVVLDATMPVMTGRQAFDRIRAASPAVPVLFASGYPAAQSVPDPMPERSAYLHKPYTPGQLAAEVRRLLDGTT